MQRIILILAFFSIALVTSCGGGGGGGGTPASTASTSSTGALGVSHNAGQDCLSCHKTGGTGAAKGIFTLAGTVYKSGGAIQPGAIVRLFRAGTNIENINVTTDSSGNFYTTLAVADLFVPGGPFVNGNDVVVEGPTGQMHNMPGIVSTGACNTCHGTGGANGHIIGD